MFAHYYPLHGYREGFDNDEKIYAIPRHWEVEPTSKEETRIQMHGTAMEEPDCPNHWCRTETSIKWSGPGEDGVWIAPNGERYPFDPTKPVCMNKDDNCEAYGEVECEKNPSYMWQFCAKTCGKCARKGIEEEL